MGRLSEQEAGWSDFLETLLLDPELLVVAVSRVLALSTERLQKVQG